MKTTFKFDMMNYFKFYMNYFEIDMNYFGSST